MEEARRRQEEAAAALIAATTTPQHQHVNEGDQDEGDDDEETPNGDMGGRDLISDSDLSNSIRDPVEDRLTLAEKNERLQNQLKVLNVSLHWSFYYYFFLWSKCRSS